MINKILIIGPAWVGDMVMAQCLFKILKQRDPHCVIDVLAPAWSVPLLVRMPEVSESMIMPIGHGELQLKKRYQIGRSLRSKKYTRAIVLPNSFKSALIPFFANIPKRTGFRGEMRYGVLNDCRILDKNKYPLMIEQFMALGLPENEVLYPQQLDFRQGGNERATGVYEFVHEDCERVSNTAENSSAKGKTIPYPLPEFKINAKDVDAALQKYQLSFSKKPLLVLCPGAEFGPAKRWPENYYAEVALAKLNEGWQVWLFGSPKDGVVADAIMQQTDNRCVNLTGKTQLADAVDLLSLATAVVANDSGLMHIAAALKKPLIAVYGPTSPDFTPPLHDKATIVKLSLPCQPCFARECPLKHHQCMLDLKPEEVLRAINQS